MPFTTGVVGDYPNDWLAELLFSSNILMISAFFLVNWRYATHDRRLVDADLPQKRIQRGTRRTCVLVLVSLAATVLSLLSPSAASYCFLAVPVLLFLPWFR